MESNRVGHLEGTYKDHWDQLPDYFRANQKLKHSREGIIQISSSILTGRGHQHLCQCLTTLSEKRTFLVSALTLPRYSSVPFPHAVYREQSLVSLSLVPLLRSSGWGCGLWAHLERAPGPWARMAPEEAGQDHYGLVKPQAPTWRSF